MSPTITLVVNAKDEENNIYACLESAEDVDEIILVDMNSKDRTREIAYRFGAKVLSVPDYGYVEPARNVGPDAAESDFVLILDADERLSPWGGIDLLRKHAEEADAWGIPTYTWFADDYKIEGSGFADHVKPRFFKKGMIRWNGAIHEMPEGTLGMSSGTTEDVWIDNYAFNDVGHLLEKCIRYGRHDKVFDDGPLGCLFDGLWEIVNRFDPDKDGSRSAALAIGVGFMRMSAGLFELQEADWPDSDMPSRKELFDRIRDFASKLPEE